MLPNYRQLMFAAMMGTMLLVGGAALAWGTQPECTGDRHYDSEANGCCPNVPECQECAPVLPCPDPAPCPTVECKDGNDGSVTYVEVACPAYVPEVLEVGKVRRDGTVLLPRSKGARKNGNGPRRIYVPRSLIDKLQAQGY